MSNLLLVKSANFGGVQCDFWRIVDHIDYLPDIEVDHELGAVYAIEYGSFLKIGKSKNPKQRLKSLASHSGKYSNVKIGRIIVSKGHVNYSENEALIHQHFHKYRKEGTELFGISLEQFIEEMPTLEYKERAEEIQNDPPLVLKIIALKKIGFTQEEIEIFIKHEAEFFEAIEELEEAIKQKEVVLSELKDSNLSVELKTVLSQYLQEEYPSEKICVMNNLNPTQNKKQLELDSREVAEMMGKRHANLSPQLVAEDHPATILNDVVVNNDYHASRILAVIVKKPEGVTKKDIVRATNLPGEVVEPVLANLLQSRKIRSVYYKPHRGRPTVKFFTEDYLVN